MAVAAKELNFELAAELRDRLIVIKGQLGQKLSPKPKTGVSNERTINCKGARQHNLKISQLRYRVMSWL